MARGFGVVAMRARADLRRRWPTFLVLALLVGGLAAGVVAAAAGARRTASAYPRLLAASGSVDLILPRDESTLVEQISADPAVSEAVAIDALTGRFFLEKGGALLADCTVNEMSVIVSDTAAGVPTCTGCSSDPAGRPTRPRPARSWWAP